MPLLCRILPNTGSMVCIRHPYSSLRFRKVDLSHHLLLDLGEYFRPLAFDVSREMGVSEQTYNQSSLEQM